MLIIPLCRVKRLVTLGRDEKAHSKGQTVVIKRKVPSEERRSRQLEEGKVPKGRKGSGNSEAFTIGGSSLLGGRGGS